MANTPNSDNPITVKHKNVAAFGSKWQKPPAIIKVRLNGATPLKPNKTKPFLGGGGK